jgi:hypothetical protein
MLCKYVWDSQPHKRLNFTELIKTVVKELVRIYSDSSRLNKWKRWDGSAR